MENKAVDQKSEIRVDSKDKALGRAKYCADIPLENKLSAHFLRSPFHHAKIISINTSIAEKIEGVVKIVTARDIPGQKVHGPEVEDKPVLCDTVVRHIGDPVAMILAVNKEIAEKASKEIKVEYQELPAVFDPLEAIESPNAPQIHPEGNVCAKFHAERGNLEEGFSDSDIVFEQSLRVQRISPAYLEPEVSAASYQPDGSIIVWVNTQMPFDTQNDICKVLGLPKEKVQVIVPAIGGSFGGKSDSSLHILSALGAWITHQNVQIINSREESRLAHPKRHPGILNYKVGAKKDGTIVSLKVDFLLDTGAYANYGPAVAANNLEASIGPYRIPNIDVTTRSIYTNSSPSGTVRGAGGPQGSFGCETIMDILAEKLDLDPVEVRQRNIWQKGDDTVFGVKVMEPISLNECLVKAQEARERLKAIPAAPGKISGVGLAGSYLKMGMGVGTKDEAFTRIEWLPNGKVRLWIGAPDIGQGIKTVGAQITAEELGLSIDCIELAPLNTSNTPYGGPTNTSHTTYITGNSLIRTAKKAIALLLDFAASELDVSIDDLDYSNGRVITKSKKDLRIPFGFFSSRAAEKDVQLIAEEKATFPVPKHLPENLPNHLAHVVFCYGAHVARVEVDPLLGTVEVKDYVAIHDVGRAVNRINVEGQIEGAIVMGVGYATMEDMKLRPNGSWIDNFTEYLIPTISDIPRIETIILENGNPLGESNIMGIGEPSAVAVAPAITSAVFDATKRRIVSLPIDSEDLITEN